MSHVTTLRTKMVERESLERALTDLGHVYETGDVEVRFAGRPTAVEIKVPIGKRRHAVGFRKARGAYEIVGDWRGINSIVREDLLRKVTQRYAYHATRAKLAEQGFEIADEQVEQDGHIHLLLRRVT